MKQIGGQAVIEGVLMRHKSEVATAVRRADNKISVKKETINVVPKNFFTKLPFVRGIVVLIESLVVGIKSLNYSANESMAGSSEDHEEEELSTWQLALTLIVSFGFAIAIFKFLPLLLTQGVQLGIPYLKENVFAFNLIEGILKSMIFVFYVWIISLMPDIKRVFEYHGAEHKTIHTYEAGEKLTPDNVKNHTTLHPRCGTSFIIFVLLLSILVYAIIPNTMNFWIKFLLRVALLPVIAGLSYEVIKLSAKFPDNIILKIIDAPGMWIQRLTTKEPSKEQIQVAIAAFNGVAKED